MRRIWWTRIDIQSLVKNFGLLVLAGVLMIPTSLSFAGDAVWLRYVLLSLMGLLVLYTLYTTFAVFYIVDEEELTVFYCWKFYHFNYHSIKRVEPYYGLSSTDVTLGRSKIKVKLVLARNDIYISPSNRDKFLEVLKERRKGKTFKG